MCLGLTGLGNAQVACIATHDHLALTRAYSPAMSMSENMSENDEHEWYVDACDVKEMPLRWLWEGRIPLGAITVLDGDPGLGKSLVTLDLAARVTRGRQMPWDAPALEEGPAGVVLLSAEDGLATTIVPRLRIAAADLRRVRIIRNVPDADSQTGQSLSRPFRLPRDIPFLEHAIQRKDARLVVIDPLMAYLDTSVNSWSDQDVRSALAPLAALAERTGVAMLILRHLNKSAGKDAGISPATLRRARERLALGNRREGNRKAARSLWFLREPSADDDAPRSSATSPPRCTHAHAIHSCSSSENRHE